VAVVVNESEKPMREGEIKKRSISPFIVPLSGEVSIPIVHPLHTLLFVIFYFSTILDMRIKSIYKDNALRIFISK